MQSDENKLKLEQMFCGKELFDEENKRETRLIREVLWDGTQFLANSLLVTTKGVEPNLETYCINHMLLDMIAHASRRSRKSKRRPNIIIQVNDASMLSPSTLTPIEQRRVPLSASEEADVKDVFLEPFSEEVMIEKYNVNVSKSTLACLRPGTWLNDEVINFYMQLLKERDDTKANKCGRRVSKYFSSFFMSKFVTDGECCYDNVKR